jgi:hypothetical protein
MRKIDEKDHPSSCWNKAKDTERLFVLLERDAAAPATIRAWIAERIRLGLNQPGDAKLKEAEELAACMVAPKTLDLRTKGNQG